MSRFGITFNGKHSYKDFGLLVKERSIGNPSKIKTKERIPYSNQVFDFSKIYGGQEYEERSISYVFNLKDYDKVDLSIKRIEILNWLMQPNEKLKLVDDYIPGYYFLAEAEQGIDYVEKRFNVDITVNFTAYPFKIAELKEGNDIWDEFNFLLDVAQVTDFVVNGSQQVNLINPGVTIAVPKIVCNTPMEIKKDGITYTIPSGKTESLDFILEPGENRMTIEGNGNISFEFYKELI